MYFDQGNIQCWRDQCEKLRVEVVKLKAQLADQREERRFHAAKDILAAMWGNPDITSQTNIDGPCVSVAIRSADALIAELEKKEEVCESN